MKQSAMQPMRAWHPYALLLPTLLVLGAFFVYPMLLALWRSFFAWDLLTEPRWVGAANYTALIASGELFAIAGRTLLYSAMVVVLASSFGLALAVVLDKDDAFHGFVRGAVFSAYIVSWVAVGLLWLWLLDADAGLISRAFKALHLPVRAWLSDPAVALPTLALVSVWKITGYAMVIFLAGLQDIPKTVLEAAALDGASPWRRFWRVTWPLLRPTAAFVATTSLILSFQAFDIVRVMTQGGPVKATTIFVYAIYEAVFMNLRVGRASALTVVLFVMLIGLTLLQLWTWRRSATEAS